MAERQLLIFTEQFPYGKSELFLQTELQYLAPHFDKIIVIPLIAKGKITHTLPLNVHVNATFANNRNKLGGFILSVRHLFVFRLLYNEIAFRWRRIVNPRAFKRLLRSSLHVVQTQNWLTKYIKQIPDTDQILCYTYFLTGVSLGIGITKQQHNRLKLVSRVHGFDVYEDDYPSRYIPYHQQTLARLNALFPISQHALTHLEKVYELKVIEKHVSRLGVKPLPNLCSRSNKGIFSIISCSNLIPLKQIDKLIDGIALFAKKNPDLNIIWNQFGVGPLHNQLEKQARKCLPQNVVWQIKYLEHSQVLEFYCFNPVDIFVNLSTSEGIPVSIMEAFSCGIPAIATNVNGVPEIVNTDNGILLPVDIGAINVMNALQEFLEFTDDVIAYKRKAAYKMWQNNFSANINYPKHAEMLLHVLSH